MDKPGTIFTFYSYKGGTGRSLALANVAWILASNGKRVLVIDWDLEAPGLHRYFHPFLIDSELNDTPGLIDYFWDYGLRMMTPVPSEEPADAWHDDVADLDDFAIRLDWDFGGGGLIDFIAAGRQDADYANRVNSFDWNNFYSRLDGEVLLERLREQLKRDYDYVLIDSRTGVSDTAGICTIALPDRLVALFTLNKQSVDGVDAVLESVEEGRGQDAVEIFPVITRVELAEKERLERARKWARRLFDDYARSKRGGASAYWTDAEILYQPYYAYEEVLATFADPTGRQFSENSLVGAMLRLSRRVTGEDGLELPDLDPETRESVLLRFTQGVERRGPESHEIESADERDERAARYFDRSPPSPLEVARRKARLAMVAVTSTAVLGIIAGIWVLILGIGRIQWSTDGNFGGLGLYLSAAGISIAVCKALQLTAAKPRILEPSSDAVSVDPGGPRRIGITGNLMRRTLSSATIVATVSAIGLDQAWMYFLAKEHDRSLAYVFVGLLVALLIAETLIESMRMPVTWVVEKWRENQLSRERRLYIHGLGPYVEGSSKDYRRFLMRVDELVEARSEPVVPGEGGKPVFRSNWS